MIRQNLARLGEQPQVRVGKSDDALPYPESVDACRATSSRSDRPERRGRRPVAPWTEHARSCRWDRGARASARRGTAGHPRSPAESPCAAPDEESSLITQIHDPSLVAKRRELALERGHSGSQVAMATATTASPPVRISRARSRARRRISSVATTPSAPCPAVSANSPRSTSSGSSLTRGSRARPSAPERERRERGGVPTTATGRRHRPCGASPIRGGRGDVVRSPTTIRVTARGSTAEPSRGGRARCPCRPRSTRAAVDRAQPAVRVLRPLGIHFRQQSRSPHGKGIARMQEMDRHFRRPRMSPPAAPA